MTVSVSVKNAQTLIAGKPVSRVVVATVAAVGGESAKDITSDLGFSSIDSFAEMISSAAMPLTLSAGLLTVTPAVGGGKITIQVWGS